MTHSNTLNTNTTRYTLGYTGTVDNKKTDREGERERGREGERERGREGERAYILIVYIKICTWNNELKHCLVAAGFSFYNQSFWPVLHLKPKAT